MSLPQSESEASHLEEEHVHKVRLLLLLSASRFSSLVHSGLQSNRPQLQRHASQAVARRGEFPRSVSLGLRVARRGMWKRKVPEDQNGSADGTEREREGRKKGLTVL